MKKQIVLLTGLLALANSTFAAETTPALTLNSLAKEIKDVANQSIVVKVKDFLPVAETSDFMKLIDDNFKNLSKPELLNIQAASLALHNAYQSASEKLENALTTSKIAISPQSIDKLIGQLVKLYQGESFANVIKGLPFGYTEGPTGKILALVANASNYIQNLHSKLAEIKVLPKVLLPANIRHGGIITTTSKSLIPALKTTEGTFIAQDDKTKCFIAYAIGRLVIYKSELITTQPVGPETRAKTNTGLDVPKGPVVYVPENPVSPIG